MQRNFVRCYVNNGGNGSQAARDAGYSVWRSDAHAWELLKKPHVRAAIWLEREKVIKCNLASLGALTMRQLMQDDDTPAHVRFQAARWSLEAAGHVAAQKSLGLPTADKALGEMTIAELEEFTKTGTKALEQLKQAKIIEVSESEPLTDTKDIAEK